MIAELGQFALSLAATLALMQLLFPWLGMARRNPLLLRLAVQLPALILLCVTLAFGLLIALLILDDFSVRYVAAHSNSQLPLFFKVSAAWGGHEGSLLLWTFLLALWSWAGVGRLAQSLPASLRIRMLAILGGILSGFLLFITLTSSPFIRLDTLPPDGRSLNPLLQDVALALHPPLLYAGYVGLALPYALAMATLWSGYRRDGRWASWMRAATLPAWIFLTLGIMLGSAWAYYELGWGGWWFWDPVENASLLPWLASVALIHSLIVTQQRHVFQSWSLLLAIIAFSLSLLGTFLVRSGVLTSVHAFANDPGRGLFILIFIFLAAGSGFWLYARRGECLNRVEPFAPLSREMVFLLNNVILLTLLATILFGTLYPLVLDALDIAKISVGPPYFNKVTAPLIIPLALLMGLGLWTKWRHDSPSALLRRLRWTLTLTLLGGLFFAWMLPPAGDAWRWTGPPIIGWILFSTWDWWRQRHARRLEHLGMALAHSGMAVTLAGILLTATYGVQKDVRMAAGDRITLLGVRFSLDDLYPVRGPNYLAQRGVFTLESAGFEKTMISEKRIYDNSAMPMTEAGIDLFRGWFVALGERLPDGAWAVRLQVQPYLFLIWGGALLMAAGGLLSLWSAWRRRTRRRAQGGKA